MMMLHTYLLTRRRCLYKAHTAVPKQPKHIRDLTKAIIHFNKQLSDLPLNTHTNLLLLITLSIISLCLLLFHWRSTRLHTQERHLSFVNDDIPNIHPDSPWVTFGGYVGYPAYYTKKGSSDGAISQQLVTIASFCDINLLYEARRIAMNYKGGPISISVFFDSDINAHDAPRINQLLDEQFENLDNTHDLTIGLLYINKSNGWYQSKGFHDSTPLAFRLPMNPLRNLAEYQVTTEWIFSIDIDFWYLSSTLNDQIHSYLKQMIDITSVHADKSIFIVPSFEVLRENKDTYAQLQKHELVDLIHQNDIIPFHAVAQYDANNVNKTEWTESNAQGCTEYAKWYGADTNYKLDYEAWQCSLYYEPWYIMKSELSRDAQYQWNNAFVGRGYSKTSRVNVLRHYCFNFYVMKDLFMIHAADTKHVEYNQTSNNYWTAQNRELLIKQRREEYKDRRTCLTPPITVKATNYLRAIVFGFGQVIADYLL
eukprot:63504_1